MRALSSGQAKSIVLLAFAMCFLSEMLFAQSQSSEISANMGLPAGTIRPAFSLVDDLYLMVGSNAIFVDGFSQVAQTRELLSRFDDSGAQAKLYGNWMIGSTIVRIAGDILFLSGSGIAGYGLASLDSSGLFLNVGEIIGLAGVAVYAIGLAVRSEAYRYLLDSVWTYNQHLANGG